VLFTGFLVILYVVYTCKLCDFLGEICNSSSFFLTNPLFGGGGLGLELYVYIGSLMGDFSFSIPDFVLITTLTLTFSLLLFASALDGFSSPEAFNLLNLLKIILP